MYFYFFVEHLVFFIISMSSAPPVQDGNQQSMLEAIWEILQGQKAKDRSFLVFCVHCFRSFFILRAQNPSQETGKDAGSAFRSLPAEQKKREKNLCYFLMGCCFEGEYVCLASPASREHQKDRELFFFCFVLFCLFFISFIFFFFRTWP